MSRTGAHARRNANHAWAEESCGEDRGKPIWPCTRCPVQKLSYLPLFRVPQGTWSNYRPRCTGWDTPPSSKGTEP